MAITSTYIGRGAYHNEQVNKLWISHRSYYVAIRKKKKNLESEVPLYIHIKIFKLKEKKDEATP